MGFGAEMKDFIGGFQAGTKFWDDRDAAKLKREQAADLHYKNEAPNDQNTANMPGFQGGDGHIGYGDGSASGGTDNVKDPAVYNGFMDAVKAGSGDPNHRIPGVTNPFGLAAIASTGQAESGYSAGNAAGDWQDGQNRAGGIMSWNGVRLEKLRAFNGGKNGTPQQQAAYFLQEDPALIQKLNSAKSLEEAQAAMNSAWRYTGFDPKNPLGDPEGQKRLAASSKFLPQFKDGGGTATASSAPSTGGTSAQASPAIPPAPAAEAAPAAAAPAAPAPAAQPAPAPAAAPVKTSQAAPAPAPQQFANNALAPAPQQSGFQEPTQTGPQEVQPGQAPGMSSGAGMSRVADAMMLSPEEEARRRALQGGQLFAAEGGVIPPNFGTPDIQKYYARGGVVIPGMGDPPPADTTPEDMDDDGLPDWLQPHDGSVPPPANDVSAIPAARADSIAAADRKTTGRKQKDDDVLPPTPADPRAGQHPKYLHDQAQRDAKIADAKKSKEDRDTPPVKRGDSPQKAARNARDAGVLPTPTPEPAEAAARPSNVPDGKAVPNPNAAPAPAPAAAENPSILPKLDIPSLAPAAPAPEPSGYPEQWQAERDAANAKADAEAKRKQAVLSGDPNAVIPEARPSNVPDGPGAIPNPNAQPVPAAAAAPPPPSDVPPEARPSNVPDGQAVPNPNAAPAPGVLPANVPIPAEKPVTPAQPGVTAEAAPATATPASAAPRQAQQQPQQAGTMRNAGSSSDRIYGGSTADQVRRSRPANPVYNSPRTQGVARQATHGALGFLSHIFGFDGSSNEGAIPSRQQGGGNVAGMRRFMSGEGAGSPQEIQAVYKTVDPNNEMSVHDKTIQSLSKTYQFYMSRGRKAEASAAAANLLQYGSNQVSHLGALANESYGQFLQTKNPAALEHTLQFLNRAYEYVPDGAQIDLHVDKATNQIVLTHTEADGTVNERPVQPQELQGLVQGTMNKSLYWKMIHETADPAGAHAAYQQEAQDRRSEATQARQDARTQQTHQWGLEKEGRVNDAKKLAADQKRADQAAKDDAKKAEVVDIGKVKPLEDKVIAAQAALDADPKNQDLIIARNRAASDAADAMPPKEVDKRFTAMGIPSSDWQYVPKEKRVAAAAVAPPRPAYVPAEAQFRSGKWIVKGPDGKLHEVLQKGAQ